METRFSRALDSMLVESYVNLDCNQLDSSKVVALFKRVFQSINAILTIGRIICTTLSLSNNSTMDRFCTLHSQCNIINVHTFSNPTQRRNRITRYQRCKSVCYNPQSLLLLLYFLH
jgi:hypothetical protein